jgi:hypothetical protein
MKHSTPWASQGSEPRDGCEGHLERRATPLDLGGHERLVTDLHGKNARPCQRWSQPNPPVRLP